jgi:hypothetical protein
MDRILLEQECVEVLEEAFKDFPLVHVSFHNLDRGKTGSVAKLWQELLTEFPIDKKRATFEFLARAIQSTQTMSVNTANEYTSFMYKVHEVEKTLGQATFSVQEVMFLMEMTNFQQWMTRCTRKSGPAWKRCLMQLVKMIFPSTKFARKISGFLKRKENILNSTRSRPIFPVRRCRIVLVAPSIVSMVRGSWRDIDPRVIHAAKASKTRALMTGVESGDYLDSAGNIVSVDNDFSRAAEVQGLEKQALKIELEKIEAEAEYKNKDKVARAFISRFEREEREDD